MSIKIRNVLTIITLLLIVELSKEYDFAKAGMNWPESCKKDGFQSPIDIAPPFTRNKPEIEFNYDDMNTEYLFYSNGKNLILEGDFGYLKYEDKIYFSNQAHFYKPSSHTISNHRYPLEMQILHSDSEGNMVTVCLFFKEQEAAFSTLLGKLKFDNENLKILFPYVPIEIKEQIDLSKYIFNGQDFFHYDAVQTAPPCTIKNKIIIMTDVLNCGTEQLKNFPIGLFGNNRVVQYRYDRPIYLTFDYLKSVERKIEMNHKKVEESLEKELLVTRIEIVEELQILDNNKKVDEEDKDKIKETVHENNKEVKNIFNGNDTEVTLDEKKEALDKLYDTLNLIKNTNVGVTEKLLEELAEKVENSPKKEGEIPFELAAEIAFQDDENQKKVEVNIIGKQNDISESLIIDKEMPLTENFETSEDLVNEYQRWIELKKEIEEKGDQVSASALIELAKIEKKLMESHYEPYLIDIGIKPDLTNLNVNEKSSFIETESQINDNNAKVDSLFLNNYAYKKYFMKDVVQDVNATLDVPKINSSTDDFSGFNETDLEKLKKEYLGDNNEKKDNCATEGQSYLYTIERNKYISKEVSESNLKFYNINNEKNNDNANSFNNMKNSIKDHQRRVEVKKEKEKEQNSIKELKLKDTIEKTIEVDEIIETVELVSDNVAANVDTDINIITHSTNFTDKIFENTTEKCDYTLINDTIVTNSTKDINVNKTTIYTKVPKKFKDLWIKDGLQIADNYEINDDKSTLYLELFEILFNTVSQLCLEFDEKNKNNPFYYPCLNGDQKVKLSHYTLSRILSFAYELDKLKQILLKDRFNTILKYILNLLDRQNKFYQIISITPVEYVFPACGNEEDKNKKINIFLDIVNNSENEYLKKSEDLSTAFMNTLLLTSPIVIIEKETEKLETYQKYPDDLIDYLSLQYFRNKTLMNRKTDQNFIGNRGHGRKSYDIEGKITQKENNTKFLLPKDKNCINNIFQSPINIEGPYIAEEYKLNFNFKPPSSLNGGVNISTANNMYKIKGNFGEFSHEDNTYKVYEVLIHHPSEHTFGENQTRADLEMQIIGKNDEKNTTAAVASFFKIGDRKSDIISNLGFDKDNLLYANYLRNFHKIQLQDPEKINQINLASAIGIDSKDMSAHFVTYNGTLTYDECQEVQWFILEKQLSVTKLQLEYFSVLVGKKTNIRPLQLLNGRILKAF